MSTAEVASILILLLTTGALLLRRPFFVRHIKPIFWSALAIMGLVLIYEAGLVYFSWHNGTGPSPFLLPPYTPINYFLFYTGVRIFLPYLLSLAFAGIAFLAVRYTNKRLGERFFYPAEEYLLALPLFLCGHPFWLAYLVVCALAYTLYASATADRVSLYYLWLPLGLVVVALTPIFSMLPWLRMLML